MPRISHDNGQNKEIIKDTAMTMANISYFTLYRFASKWDKLLITISITASFISGATLPYAITLVASVFQLMITYDKSVQDQTQDSERFLRNMHIFGIHYSCIGVVLFIGGYLGNALMSITAINQVYRIRREYLTAVLNQDFTYFDLHQTGDFASKMSDDLIKLEEGINDKVSAMVYSSTTAIGCVFMALLKGWKLALLCLTTTPLTFSLVGITGRIADRLYQQEASHTSKASAVAQEVLSSIRTVYSFNAQEKELERYKKPLSEAKKIYIKKEFFTGLSMGFLFLCVFCSYALSFYFGIYLMVNDPSNYNADVMFSVFFGVMTALGNFGIVGSLVRSFGLAKGAGAQIFHLLDNVPTINPLLDRGMKPPVVEGTIEFKNVVFQYPSRPDVPVLKGLSLSVKRGQTVALVGHSGCGKSTVIQLISRYYDVFSGSVCVDGYDVRDLSVKWLRSKIGLVGQEPVLFNTSVRENIRYGKEGATDDEVVAVAKQASAHQFILKLPKGYDTLVGERGASLSGGQKQRLAIARALIRNPHILLLDEATSALDMASEAKVQQALDVAAKGRTTIVVAHRLSTVRHADLICVIKDGILVESGKHEDLMASKGPYYDMVVLQEPQEMYGEDTTSLQNNADLIQEDIEDSISVMVSEELKKIDEKNLSFWRVLDLKAREWRWLAFGTVSSLIIGFAMPLFIVVFGDLFGSMSDPDPNKLMGKVNYVSTVCITIGVVMGFSNLIEALSFGVAGAHLTERLRVRLFGHMLKQDIAFFDHRTNSTGGLCAKLSAEPAYVQGATGQRIGHCFQGIGSVGLAIILAMMFEWRVGLVAMAFAPVVVVVIYQQSKTTSEESFGNAKTLENSTKIALEAVSNVRTVVSLGRESLFVSEYIAELRPAIAPARRSAHCRAIVAGLSRSMFNFINSASLVYGGHLIVAEGVAYQDILVTTQSLQMASGQAQGAFAFAPDLQKGLDAASRIAALLTTAPKVTDPTMPVVTPFKSKGEASLKDVEFTYPTRPGVKVLNHMDMMVPNGKTIGLVGHSGCGKSTIIQLLQRFYDPQSGVVCLDEYPLPSLLVHEARYALGLVSQEPVLFDCSISDNISYGDMKRTVSRDELIQAAKLANIHAFVVSLPQGYDTNIGTKGMQLSGGQKQRVAIARALIRQPKILLLDEATSALDTESEKVVQGALDSARVGRTCITIAHRLSSVRGADLICVLSGGKVAEAGTHPDLINLKGIYYSLHRASQ